MNRRHRQNRRVGSLTGVALGLAALLTLAACGTQPSPGASEPGNLTTLTLPATRALTPQPTGPDGAPDCPATISDRDGMTVPSPPQGVDGNSSLVPPSEPTSMTVCAYPVLDIASSTPPTAPFALSRRTVASPAQRAEVSESLRWAPRSVNGPRPCTMMAGDETVYLVGLTYPDAALWVAALAEPNRCSLATNGDFVARAGVGPLLDATFGHHQLVTSAAPCAASSTGRLGDEVSLAPPGDPTVTVCRQNLTAGRTVALDPQQSRAAVAALRSLRTVPSDGTCTVRKDAPLRDDDFTLVLRYAAGPAVVVDVSATCRPAVRGAVLAADDGTAVIDLVRHWRTPTSGSGPGGDFRSTPPSPPRDT